MHEFAIVESMLSVIQTRLDEIGVEQGEVAALHFERGSTFSEDALRQSFEIQSAGTLLEHAELIVDTANFEFACGCGHTQVITSDDLIGHMYVCPTCGVVREIDEAHDLKLIEVIFKGDPRLESLKLAEATS
jgi:Zn finger protein HypA/HybF involved in hydrogenase expression